MIRRAVAGPLVYPILGVATLMVGCGAQPSGKSADAPAATPAAATSDATSGAPASAQSSAGYPSLAGLPDWSGAWGALVRPTTPVTDLLLKEPSPLKPAALAQMRKTRSATDAGVDPGLARDLYCRPYEYGGLIAGLEGRIEFLYTPGRVTIITENGLIRRVYTDGRPLPADPEASNAGTSIGHWEGKTLVVETTGLNPEANIFDVRYTPPIGHSAKTTEHIFVRDDGVLEVDTVLDAPDVLSRPVQFNMTYRRFGDLPMGEYSACPKFDRAIDPKSGKQRFDLTPPSDLPPPPK